VLQRVEEAGLRVAAGGLPARDHGAGGFVEPAADLGVEAEAVEAALHVAALVLVETDLVFVIWLASSVKVRGSIPVVRLRVAVDGPSCSAAMRASASDLKVPFG